jgi:hypothetical protein
MDRHKQTAPLSVHFVDFTLDHACLVVSYSIPQVVSLTQANVPARPYVACTVAAAQSKTQISITSRDSSVGLVTG